MNIIVRPYGKDSCYCRPDTTWERENRDLYSPDCVNEWYWTPVVFARISKAGKCISPKFAERYYDSVNFGMLLYAGNSETAFSSCADRTSILPAPLYNPVVLENEDNMFEVLKQGETIFKTGTMHRNLMEDSICRASQMTSLRIGDMVAVELTPVSLLADRTEGEIRLEAAYCGNSLSDLRIIF